MSEQSEGKENIGSCRNKIASMYDSKNLEYNNPPITSIRFDTVRLGKMACAKLLNILGEKPLEDTVPLNYQVVLRESTQ